MNLRHLYLLTICSLCVGASTLDAQGAPTGSQSQVVSSLGATAGSSLGASLKLNDYVPCNFSVGELMALRPQPKVVHLTMYDQSELVRAIGRSIVQIPDDQLGEEEKQAIIARLNGLRLVGKTPGEALATVLDAIYQVDMEAAQARKAANQVLAAHKRDDMVAFLKPRLSPRLAGSSGFSLLFPPSSENPQELLEKIATNIRTAVQNDLSDVRSHRNSAEGHQTTAQKEYDDAKKQSEQLAKELDDATKAWNDNVAARKEDVQAAKDALTTAQKGQENSTNTTVVNSAQAKLDQANAALKSATEILNDKNAALEQANIQASQAQDAVKDAETAAEKDLAMAGVLEQAMSSQRQNAAPAADAARTAVQQYSTSNRPTDIGCAFSLLTYDETRLAFGRAVADRYIALQVIVRNVNPDNEFLLHDAELCVDDDINGTISPCVSGRDRRIVRDVLNNGDPETLRTHIINGIAGLSSIMSVVSPLFNVAPLSDASHTVAGAVIPGANTLFPSSTQKQSQLLDDMGFGASASFKTVVPKSQSVAFVIFEPSKPFEAGWWAQQCALEMFKPSAGPMPPATGLDLARARDVCKELNLVKDSQLGTLGTVAFKKWTGPALKLFEKLVVVAVSGTHINELKTGTPTLSSVDCKKKNAQGQVDLAQADAGGNLSCPVTGDQIDKLSTLKLMNGGDTKDVATGSVSVSAGSPSVTFKFDDLCSLAQSSYSVYASSQTITEFKTDATLFFDIGPQYLKTDTASVNVADLKKSGITMNLSGCHLGQLKDKETAACLSAMQGTVKVTDDKTLALTFAAAATPPVSAGAKGNIFIGACNAASTDTGLTVTFK